MKNHHYFAIDIGNSWYKAMISDRGSISEYVLPNVIAPYDEEFFEKPYDEDDVVVEENLIVEVMSKAIKGKREVYYIGKSAARQRDVSLTTFNNQKADEDRTYVLLFGLIAQHALQTKNNLDTDIHYSIDQLAISLPTTQYKEKKDSIRERLLGNHTVALHNVPHLSEPKELLVKIQVNDVIIGAEGACAYLGLTHDYDSLKVIDEGLIKDTQKGILIGDLGGDSVDFVGIKNNKPIASIEGDTFGINQFLDQIIQKISKHELYTFDSRSELEEKLIAGPSEWYVEPFAGVKKDISKYVIPQLRSLSIKFLEHFDRIRYSSNEIKGASRYLAVGGAAKLAKEQILEASIQWSERGRPIDLLFPEDMEKLNVYGLMVLAKLNQIKKSHNRSDRLVLAKG